MAKRKTKSAFIGLRLTADQVAELAALQESLNCQTKTEVLTQALSLLSKLGSPGPALSPEQMSKARERVPALGMSSELSELDAEAQEYAGLVQQAISRTREVSSQMIQELSRTDEIIDKHGGEKSALIQVLLELQRENRWLSEESLQWISRRLDIPLTEIYHVATFYTAFSLVPLGRHSVSVCMGTACQVREAPRLLDRVTDALQIKPGETSKDRSFSLNTVNCLGCCALGPVMVVDAKYYSNPSADELKKIVAECA